MQDERFTFTEVHTNTLLEIDAGYSRFHPAYPPAAHLVRFGYAQWRDNNPSTWELELTDFGSSSIALIKCPDVDDSIYYEPIDDRVCRIMHDGHIKGFAVKYPNDRWVAFDESSIRISDKDFSSPASIVIMMKMQEAEMTLALRESMAADLGVSAPRF